MKSVLKKAPALIFATIVALIAIGFSSCEEDDTELLKSLDNELYGRWELQYGSSENVTGYTFFSDGTAMQTIYGQDRSWQWRVENSSIVFYVEGGEESDPLRYKVHGRQLFLWSEEIDDWGAPMTKIW